MYRWFVRRTAIVVGLLSLASAVVAGAPMQAVPEDRIFPTDGGLDGPLAFGDFDCDGSPDLVASGSLTAEGAFWVFYGGPSGPIAPSMRVDGDKPFGALGFSLAVDDFNGDGCHDVAAAMRRDEPVPGAPYTFSSRYYLYEGSPAGLSSSASWSVGGDVGVGTPSVSAAGDVNADGFADLLLVTRPQESLGVFGRATLFLGGPAGLSTEPDWILEGTSYGWILDASAVGDLDGNGTADFVLRMGEASLGTTDEACWWNGGSQQSLARCWLLPEGNTWGYRIAGRADFEQDGFDDLIVSHFEDYWTIAVYRGTSTGPEETPLVLEGRIRSSYFGGEIETGDVNGDGYPDLVTGDGGDSYDQLNSGNISLFLGGPDGLTRTSVWRPDLEYSERVGESIAVADVDGDGFDDIAAFEWKVSAQIALFRGGEPIQTYVQDATRPPITNEGDEATVAIEIVEISPIVEALAVDTHADLTRTLDFVLLREDSEVAPGIWVVNVPAVEGPGHASPSIRLCPSIYLTLIEAGASINSFPAIGACLGNVRPRFEVRNLPPVVSTCRASHTRTGPGGTVEMMLETRDPGILDTLRAEFEWTDANGSVVSETVVDLPESATSQVVNATSGEFPEGVFHLACRVSDDDGAMTTVPGTALVVEATGEIALDAPIGGPEVVIVRGCSVQPNESRSFVPVVGLLVTALVVLRVRRGQSRSHQSRA